jgi:hypothetical protein
VPLEFATICAGLREVLGNAGTFFAFRGAGASLTKIAMAAKKYIFGEMRAHPRGVINSGAGANRRPVAFSGNAGIKTGSGLRIDKHRLDRARSGNFRRHAQYPQYVACSRPVTTQLEDYSGSCVPARRCRPKH